MSATITIKFYLGETLTIDGHARKADGTPLNLLGGGSVVFRVASDTTSYIKATVGTDIVLSTTIAGDYLVNIPASDSRLIAIPVGTYTFEVDATASDGGVSVQNRGNFVVLPSLLHSFP